MGGDRIVTTDVKSPLATGVGSLLINIELERYSRASRDEIGTDDLVVKADVTEFHICPREVGALLKEMDATTTFGKLDRQVTRNGRFTPLVVISLFGPNFY